MTFNLDSLLFIGFLIINLVLGFKASSGIKNIQEYAIGDRKFKTGALVATVVATCVDGQFFCIRTTEIYQHGLYFIFVTLGNIGCFLLIAHFFAPRLGDFLGDLSISEAMGKLYGNNVRLITAICGFIGVIGIIAIQLKVAGMIFEIALNMPSLYGVITAGVVVTLYSTWGGIKAVTFTDVIQFFTFGTIIPLVTLFIYNSFFGFETVYNTVLNNPNFDLDKIFDISNPKLWKYSLLFIYYLVPAFDPTIFQRISMAKDINQIKRSFHISAFICLGLTLLLSWMSIVLLSKDPNVAENDIIKTLLFDGLPLGIKGLLLIGVISMVMSTADSYINASSILITYDFSRSLKIKLKNELLTARIVSMLLGLSAIGLALKTTSIFQLCLDCLSFYMPIVTVPFIMTVCGYRTPYTKAVLYGMAAGFITVLSWFYFNITVVDSLIPAMIANLIVLVIMHYYYHGRSLA
jgi:Na+/proline symporter